MVPDLTGRVALVTGSSRGIGQAVAVRLAKAGAAVALNGRGDLSATQQLILRTEGRCSCHVADVTDSQQVERMVAEVVAAHGSLDILVSNAGAIRDSLLLRMSNADWQEVLATNLTGAFHCLRAALKPMVRRRWGRIITMGSVVGIRGNAGQANYSAAKAALVGLTRTVALEVASRGITANVVAPGFIQTEMTSKLTGPQREMVRRHIPLGDFGSPEDVAGLVTYLASEQAGYITGQVIHVDGGLALM